MNKSDLQMMAQILGARGGNARMKNSSPKQRSEWAKKGAKYGILGGRPTGTKNKPKSAKKGGKA